MGMEEVAMECIASLERKGGIAATCVVTPVRSLVDEIVEASNASNVVVARTTSADVAMSSQFRAVPCMTTAVTSETLLLFILLLLLPVLVLMPLGAGNTEVRDWKMVTG
jgi:hypothetical protein